MCNSLHFSLFMHDFILRGHVFYNGIHTKDTFSPNLYLCQNASISAFTEHIASNLSFSRKMRFYRYIDIPKTKKQPKNFDPMSSWGAPTGNFQNWGPPLSKFKKTTPPTVFFATVYKLHRNVHQSSGKKSYYLFFF